MPGTKVYCIDGTDYEKLRAVFGEFLLHTYGKLIAQRVITGELEEFKVHMPAAGFRASGFGVYGFRFWGDSRSDYLMRIASASCKPCTSGVPLMVARGVRRSS